MANDDLRLGRLVQRVDEERRARLRAEQETRAVKALNVKLRRALLAARDAAQKSDQPAEVQ